METVSDTDYCVLVTEPTPFGLNDLTLAVEMITTLGLKCGVIINRDGPDSNIIEEFCEQHQLPILMRIPFDMDIASSYARAAVLVHQDLKWRERFADLYHRIVREVQQT
jgi:MinD superfamily P-loop ATPase